LLRENQRLRKKSICGVALHLSSLRRTISTSHSLRFARLASGVFYCVVCLWTFCEFIKTDDFVIMLKNHVKTLIFLFSFIFCTQVLAAEDPDELYSEGRFAEAQEAYNNLDMKNPKDIRFRYNRGCAAYQNSDYQGAMAAFSSVLRRTKSKDPSAKGDDKIRFRAAYNMGNVAFRQGDFVSAVKYYKEVILYNSQSDDARYNLELSLKKLEEQKKKEEESKPEGSKGDKERDKQSEEEKDGKDSRSSSDEKTPDEKTQDEKETQGMDREQKEDKSGPEGREKREKEDGAASEKRQEAKGGSSKDLSGELKPRQELAEQQGENQVPDSRASVMNKKKAEALLDNINEDRSRFLRFQIPEEKRNGVSSGRDW